MANNHVSLKVLTDLNFFRLQKYLFFAAAVKNHLCIRILKEMCLQAA